MNLPMTSSHRLSLFAYILAVPLLASCGNQNPPEVARVPVLLNSSNKLEIVPQEKAIDSTQRLLGINEWKFKVAIPQAHKYLVYALEVREKGKKPRIIHEAVFGVGDGPQRRDLNLAMLPLNFDWAKNDRLKMQLSLGGSMGSGEIENPFKGCTGFSSGDAVPLPDGNFVVMEGNRPGQRSTLGGGQGQILLVLKLESSKQKPESTKLIASIN